MDKLDEIFAEQKELDEFIAKKRDIRFTKEEWIQKKAMALLVELSELLEEINYKWWKNPKQENEQAIKEELVDILHFYIGMCIDAGMDAQELFTIYRQKNKENHDRQNGKSLKKGYE